MLGECPQRCLPGVVCPPKSCTQPSHPEPSRCPASAKHPLSQGFLQTPPALPFHLAVKLHQWVLPAQAFANNFLFLILAVSVRVTDGAATVSSPALPQLCPPLSPSPCQRVFLATVSVGDSLVLRGKGLLPRFISLSASAAQAGRGGGRGLRHTARWLAH